MLDWSRAQLENRAFSVYVALTNIPVGELLTGFAMRSDPNDFMSGSKGSGLFPSIEAKAKENLELARRKTAPRGRRSRCQVAAVLAAGPVLAVCIEPTNALFWDMRVLSR